jgi:hypothetical protein
VDFSPIWIVAAVVAVSGLGRALTVLGRSSDLMASLFVPPDHSLGWPHGVQEQDVEWSWQRAAASRTPVSDFAELPTASVATVRLGSPVVGRGPSIRRGPPTRG